MSKPIDFAQREAETLTALLGQVGKKMLHGHFPTPEEAIVAVRTWQDAGTTPEHWTEDALRTVAQDPHVIRQIAAIRHVEAAKSVESTAHITRTKAASVLANLAQSPRRFVDALLTQLKLEQALDPYFSTKTHVRQRRPVTPEQRETLACVTRVLREAGLDGAMEGELRKLYPYFQWRALDHHTIPEKRLQEIRQIITGEGASNGSTHIAAPESIGALPHNILSALQETGCFQNIQQHEFKYRVAGNTVRIPLAVAQMFARALAKLSQDERALLRAQLPSFPWEFAESFCRPTNTPPPPPDPVITPVTTAASVAKPVIVVAPPTPAPLPPEEAPPAIPDCMAQLPAEARAALEATGAWENLLRYHPNYAKGNPIVKLPKPAVKRYARTVSALHGQDDVIAAIRATFPTLPWNYIMEFVREPEANADNSESAADIPAPATHEAAATQPQPEPPASTITTDTTSYPKPTSIEVPLVTLLQEIDGALNEAGVDEQTGQRIISLVSRYGATLVQLTHDHGHLHLKEFLQPLEFDAPLERQEEQIEPAPAPTDTGTPEPPTAPEAAPIVEPVTTAPTLHIPEIHPCLAGVPIDLAARCQEILHSIHIPTQVAGHRRTFDETARAGILQICDLLKPVRGASAAFLAHFGIASANLTYWRSAVTDTSPAADAQPATDEPPASPLPPDTAAAVEEDEGAPSQYAFLQKVSGNIRAECEQLLRALHVPAFEEGKRRQIDDTAKWMIVRVHTLLATTRGAGAEFLKSIDLSPSAIYVWRTQFDPNVQPPATEHPVSIPAHKAPSLVDETVMSATPPKAPAYVAPQNPTANDLLEFERVINDGHTRESRLNILDRVLQLAGNKEAQQALYQECNVTVPQVRLWLQMYNPHRHALPQERAWESAPPAEKPARSLLQFSARNVGEFVEHVLPILLNPFEPNSQWADTDTDPMSETASLASTCRKRLLATMTNLEPQTVGRLRAIAQKPNSRVTQEDEVEWVEVICMHYGRDVTVESTAFAVRLLAFQQQRCAMEDIVEAAKAMFRK